MFDSDVGTIQGSVLGPIINVFRSIISDTGGTRNQRGMSSSRVRQLVVLLVLTSTFIQLNM